ncbi:MAG: Rpn family recombination-promoting nuclease/putative transposase [Bacillota bacterium]|nr:Rpn family recombination-promoting nuclease/putative transposase [Bacillota bacterium]
MKKDEIKIKKEITREPLTSDIIFKAVYGRDTPESKAALITLLNLVLDRRDDPIVDITYKNPFSIDDCYEGKTIIMDIKAETFSGELIDIEMQIGDLDVYVNRTVFYVSKQLTEGLDRGQDYGKMKKSIVISFVKGKLFPQEIPFHSVYTMRERSCLKELSDIIELHYIELDKIRCDGMQLSEMSDLEQLGAYMKCSGNPEEKAYVEELVKKGDEVIGMTDTVLKKISEEDKLRELRIAREKWEMWVMLERTAGYDNGKADGKIEGMREGKIECAREIAANFKKAGLDIDIIAANTGLTKEEIEQL